VSICTGNGTAITLPAAVPDEVGLPMQDARQDLVCRGFRVRVVSPDALPTAIIVAEVPSPGDVSSPNATATVRVR
jgi:hypothetical protein